MTTNSTHPRERLVRTAANLVHRQGWTITGINQILTDAGIPKGSFYYYFRSKEALGVAVLQMHYATIKDLLDRTVLNTGLSPETSVSEFFRELRSGTVAEEFKFGCPAGNLANENATQCPALLTEAMRALNLYRDSWTQLIQRAQARGMIPADRNAGEMAITVAMLMQGAFLGLKCTNQFEHLDLAHATIHQLCFGAQAKTGAGSTPRFTGREAAPSHALAS